jgi:hypothetical protein
MSLDSCVSKLLCSVIRSAPVSIYQTYVMSFSEMEEVLNRYVTNPTPTLTPNHNRNSYPNQINSKIQKRNNFRN